MCWVPPQVLAHDKHGLPMFEGTLQVRSSDFRSVIENVTWLAAYSLACQGRIAAKCSGSGRVKYFRMLPDSERPDMTHTQRPEERDTASRSGVIANTKMGAYREAVQAGFFSETGGPYGEPGVEMRIISHIWQLHLAHV